jgi:hypothetical protein
LNPHAATLLVVRLIGLFIVAWRVPSLFASLGMILREGVIDWVANFMFVGRANGYFLADIGELVQLALGLYMLFGGKRLARLILPGVPGLCHRCGYDISGLDSSRCPECGAKIPVRPEPVNSRP